MIKPEIQKKECKDFFLNLIQNEDWELKYKWADKLSLNGSDGVIRFLPYKILITKEANQLCEENECIWLRDIILNAIHFLDIDKEFQVWYLFVDENNKGIIICENGNYEPMLCLEIPFTDFKNSGYSAVKFYFENNTLYLPVQR